MNNKWAKYKVYGGNYHDVFYASSINTARAFQRYWKGTIEPLPA